MDSSDVQYLTGAMLGVGADPGGGSCLYTGPEARMKDKSGQREAGLSSVGAGELGECCRKVLRPGGPISADSLEATVLLSLKKKKIVLDVVVSARLTAASKTKPCLMELATHRERSHATGR